MGPPPSALDQNEEFSNSVVKNLLEFVGEGAFSWVAAFLIGLLPTPMLGH